MQSPIVWLRLSYFYLPYAIPNICFTSPSSWQLFPIHFFFLSFALWLHKTQKNPHVETCEFELQEEKIPCEFLHSGMRIDLLCALPPTTTKTEQHRFRVILGGARVINVTSKKRRRRFLFDLRQIGATVSFFFSPFNCFIICKRTIWVKAESSNIRNKCMILFFIWIEVRKHLMNLMSCARTPYANERQNSFLINNNRSVFLTFFALHYFVVCSAMKMNIAVWVTADCAIAVAVCTYMDHDPSSDEWKFIHFAHYRHSRWSTVLQNWNEIHCSGLLLTSTKKCISRVWARFTSW